MANADIPISSVTGDVTLNVRVTGMRLFRFRLAIVRALLWCVCKVSPFPTDIEIV